MAVFTEIAAFTADGADATTPVAFVGLGTAGKVEFRFADGDSTGTPDSATFTVWREHGGAIDRMGTHVVAFADLSAPLPLIVNAEAGNFAVTLSAITGGVAPTVTMTVEARPLTYLR